MKLIVVDTETTGMEDTDQVVEVALVKILDCEITGSWSRTICPSVPMNVLARAAHHITDDEINCSPTIHRFLNHISDELCVADVLVGHNVEFDRRLLIQSGVSRDIFPEGTIDTHRCALHIFPNAPAHSNQVLRYWLELPDAPALHYPPHRALSDALVTAAILRRMMKHHSVDQLIEMSTTPVILPRVRRGMHRGKSWADVPTDYMKWILRCSDPPFDPDVVHTCKHHIEDREKKRAAVP